MQPRAYAAMLYDALHRLDAAGLDWIAVECPKDTPESAGVCDPLKRRGESLFYCTPVR